jgi:hypothetical protein
VTRGDSVMSKRTYLKCLLTILATSGGCSSPPDLAEGILPRTGISASRSEAVIPGKTAAPGWSVTEPLDAQRADHTATLLGDERVLVVGGYTSAVTLYDESRGTWKPGAPSLLTHRGHTATVLKDGRVLIAGGGKDHAGLNSEVFDPEMGTWTAIGAMSTPRYHHTATLLPDGRVLVTGGTAAEHTGPTLDSAEVYDPTTNAWSTVGPLAGARVHHTATLLPGGRVLITGGSGANDQTLATAEVFDPTTGGFSSAGTLTTPRQHHTATALADGRVLVAGGETSYEPTAAEAELFDPTTGTWSLTGKPSQPRRYQAATTLTDGQVLLTGGYHESAGILTHSEVYDPTTGAWTAAPGMATDRYRHTATRMASGVVLVVGGLSNHEGTKAELYGVSPTTPPGDDPGTPPADPLPSVCDTGNLCSSGLRDETTGACVARDRPANTDCGNEHVCDGQGTCVPTAYTAAVTCASGARTGDELCQTLGFAGATIANGYWWGQCSGAGLCPGGWQGVGLTCGSWSLGADCTGTSFAGASASGEADGLTVHERLGEGSTRFQADEFGACAQANPGWTVRLRCHY